MYLFYNKGREETQEAEVATFNIDIGMFCGADLASVLRLLKSSIPCDRPTIALTIS